MSRMLVLLMLERCNLLECNVHTKFHENLLSDSIIIMVGQTHGQRHDETISLLNLIKYSKFYPTSEETSI